MSTQTTPAATPPTSSYPKSKLIGLILSFAVLIGILCYRRQATYPRPDTA